MKSLILGTFVFLISAQCYAGKVESIITAIEASCSTKLDEKAASALIKPLFLYCTRGQEVTLKNISATCKTKCLKDSSGDVF